MNGKKRVYELTNEIKRIKGRINETNQEISMCTDKTRKNQRKKDLKRDEVLVSELYLELVRFYLDNKVDDYQDRWNSPISRRKMFEDVHLCFGKDYTVKGWKQILEFYRHFLDHEIAYMFELRTKTIFDLIEKKKPKSVLKREEIINLFDYLEEAQDIVTNFTFEEFNGIEDYRNDFIDCKKKLIELNAHLLYEEGNYDTALDFYKTLAEEHNKADSYWHSSIFWLKGDIYCAMDRYDLALKEYDSALAAVTIDRSSHEGQIVGVKERRNQIAAILGQ